MDDEIKIKNELLNILLIISVFIIILKIVFFKEKILIIVIFALSLLWIFILPGYLILWHWRLKLNTLERMVASFPISFAIVGIVSYYLGIMGIHTKYHHMVIPLFSIAIFIIILIIAKRNKNKKSMTDNNTSNSETT